MKPWKILGIPVTNKTLLGFFSFLKLGAYESVKLTRQIKIAQERYHVVAYDIINNKDVWFT